MKFKIGDDVKIKKGVTYRDISIEDFGGFDSVSSDQERFIINIIEHGGKILRCHSCEDDEYRIAENKSKDAWWLHGKFLQLYFELDVKLFKL